MNFECLEAGALAPPSVPDISSHHCYKSLFSAMRANYPGWCLAWYPNQLILLLRGTKDCPLPLPILWFPWAVLQISMSANTGEV